MMNAISRRELLAGAALGSLTGASPKRPNILLLFPDQLRHDWINRVPALDVHTPNIDALAARGMRFINAIVPSPLCAPSRACLASGREYGECGVVNNSENFPLNASTYYKLLRDSGYFVAGCGKLDLAKKALDWGEDGKRFLHEWGFSDGINNEGKHDAVQSVAKGTKGPYMAFLRKAGLAEKHLQDIHARKDYSATFPTTLTEDAYCDNWLSTNGINLIKRAPKDKPWHLAVNFTGPHSPMDITARMEKTVRGRNYLQPNGSRQFTPEVHVAIRQNYTAMVENIDRWVGKYVELLKQRGELDNTIIVFSSDHGEMLGDHSRWGKSVPWQESVGVPLIMAGPGIQHAKSDALVSVMDLAATFLDYGGVAKPSGMDSRTLRHLAEGRTKLHREYLLSGLDQWEMAWNGRHKFIRGFEAEPQLYDLAADPSENRNIVKRDKRMAEEMEAMLPARRAGVKKIV